MYPNYSIIWGCMSYPSIYNNIWFSDLQQTDAEKGKEIVNLEARMREYTSVMECKSKVINLKQ